MSRIILEPLLWQYREVLADIRAHQQRTWQIPPATAAINAVLIGLLLPRIIENQKVLQLKTTSLIAIVTIFSIAIFLTLVMLIALNKERFFEVARENLARRLQNDMIQFSTLLLRELRWQTSEIIQYAGINNWDIPINWFSRQSAFEWLLGGMVGMLWVLSAGLGFGGGALLATTWRMVFPTT